MPARDWLLVFVGDTQEDMRTAAAGAAAAGFERGAVLDGGLQAYGQAALQQVRIYTDTVVLKNPTRWQMTPIDSLMASSQAIDICPSL